MARKVCLITGATNGIGRAGAAEIAKQGWTVVLSGRDEQRCADAVAEVKAKSGNDDVSYLRADLSSVAETRRLAAEFRARHSRLDVLVNNAGAIFQHRQVSPDGYELTFAVNHLAYFVLTTELLDLLKASAPARIVNTSSGAHYAGRIHFEDIHLERSWSVFGAYGQSKLANVLFTYELARRLAGTGVTANCLHPGFVGSGFARNNGRLADFFMTLLKPFARTPERGARALVHLAVSPAVEGVTGKYFYDEREKHSSKASHDEDAARRLWELSEELTRPALAKTA